MTLPNKKRYTSMPSANRMRVSRQHGLHSMPGDLGKIGVVDASGAEVGDVGVAALMGADV
jgi:hypothetical protein